MKKISLFILIGIITLNVNAQNDNKIVIGKIDTVYSKILNEQRKIFIYTPDMTSGNKDANQRYPVLYLLDGDAHFVSVAGLVQQLSQANGNAVLPEMIIVGITNTDRTRDLTPTHVKNDLPFMDSNFSKTSGGGQNFIAFIEKELMPHIDSLYPTAPYKILVGHSFGGLTAIDVITNHTKLFNAYIAIDPSMWYDHERFLTASKIKFTRKKYAGTRLFLGIANTMPQGMTIAKMNKDTTADTKQIRSIFSMDKFLKMNKQNGLKYASKYYDNDSHVSVPLISEYDGLRFIFDYYRIDVTLKDFSDTSDAIVLKYKKHYNTVSREMGYKVSAPESFINYLGYNAMAKQQYAKAKGLFKMNLDNYPNSSNVYSSYADLLASQKDTTDAIMNYKKSLALQDNPDTKLRLNTLEGKATFTLTQKELEKYTGTFDLEEFPVTITIKIKDSSLYSSVPGQNDSQLIPLSPDTFTVKNASGFTIYFQLEAGKLTGFKSVQPNGTFNARVKK